MITPDHFDKSGIARHPAMPITHDPVPPDLAETEDAWLEDLLRAQARDFDTEYLNDDGFTARVMDLLPKPVTLPAWRKPALTALWATAGLGIAVVLPSTALDLAHDVLRVFVAHRFSVSEAGAALLALGVASWAATAYALRRA